MDERREEGVRTERGLVVPADALTWRFSRSGGPGGQHANTSDTRVELEADLSALSGPGAARVRERLGDRLVVVAAEHRSQWRNRTEARRRLAERIDEAATPPPPPRRPTRPTRGSVERRLEGKRRRSERLASRRRPEDH